MQPKQTILMFLLLVAVLVIVVGDSPLAGSGTARSRTKPSRPSKIYH
jgi:hypothetical protein